MSTVELDDTGAGWAAHYRDLGRQIADLEEQRKLAREQLEDALGDAEEGLIDGRPAVRYPLVTTTRVDVKALRSEMPDVAARYAKVSTSRRLSLVEDSA